MDITNAVPTERQPDLFARLIRLLPLLLLAAGTVWLYWNAMAWWYTEWTTEGSFYAHGVFIPFFVGLMIWRDKERLRRLPVSHNWWGMALIIVAVAMVMFAQRTQVTVTLSISFILFLIGATLLMAGKQITKALLFPYLFLFTMIPIVPDQLINPIAFPIQIVSASMATLFFKLCGFAALRTGTQIQMDHYALNVELPCSGFKTLVGLLAFAAAFAWLVEGEKWKRWTLFLSAAPLAILVNGVRITLIGLVGELMSADAAHKFHDYSGFIVLIFGFMALFSIAKLLKCERFLGIPLQDDPHTGTEKMSEAERDSLRAREAEEREREQEKMNSLYGKPRRNTMAGLAAGLYPVLAVLLIAGAVKGQIVPPKSSIPALTPEEIPAQFAGTPFQQVGKDRPIAKEIKDVLNPEGWIDRDYMGKESSMNLLISAGSGRRVFHDPHTCFMGSGYFLKDTNVETIDTAVGPVQVQVAESEDTRKHTKTLLMFLYVVDGKQIHTTQGVNTAIMWQTLLGDSGRPSYFLRFWQQSGTDEKHRTEMKQFIKAVWEKVAPRVTGVNPQVAAAP